MEGMNAFIGLMALVGVTAFVIAAFLVRFPGDTIVPKHISRKDAISILKPGGGYRGFNFSPGFLSICLFEDGLLLKPLLGRATWVSDHDMRLEVKSTSFLNRTNHTLFVGQDSIELQLMDSEVRLLTRCEE